MSTQLRCLSFIFIFTFQITDGEFEVGRTSGRIVSQNQNIQAKEGENITLPCRTVDKGRSVLVWEWNNELVSAGAVKVLDDEKIRIAGEGTELVIRNVTDKYRGSYTCILKMKNNPVHVNHTLEILVAPTVNVVGVGSHLNFTEGERVEVHCDAMGFPVPTLLWTKQDSKNGVSSSYKLIRNPVTRADAGTYTCSASNSEGVASKSVHINIFYKPLIRLGRDHFVGSGRVSSYSGSSMDNSFVISCSVEANPPATVTWYKEGKFLKSEGSPDILTQWSEQNNREVQYQLTVQSVEEADYGNYTCEARNRAGVTAKSIQFKGHPDQPVVKSSPQSTANTYYNLIWQVWSPPTLPILNQSILYRMIRKATGASLNESDGTWHNLALLSEAKSRRPSNMEYTTELTGLSPDSEYEVRIRAMNKQGWSQLSEPFYFRTAGIYYRAEMPVFTKNMLTSRAGALVPFSALLLLPTVILIME